MTPTRRPALFLDRDGVIIENRDNYVRAWDDVAFIDPALDALAELARAGHPVFLVTNQSVIGRGYLAAEVVAALNDRIVAAVAERGGRIVATYICPHAPDDACDCRKPKPGLLLRAAAEWDIDLARSIMIGDALSDLAAGRAAGVGSTVLVRTGRGRKQEHLSASNGEPPPLVADDLPAALALVGLLPGPASS